MTKISKAAMAKSRKLIVDEANRMRWRDDPKATALARYIQETSDVAKECNAALKRLCQTGERSARSEAMDLAQSLILPDDEPTAEDVLAGACDLINLSENQRIVLSRALDAAGYTITRKD